ncbi:MAG: hypothetical protein HN458_01465 [Euryarchaeota archaeon]|nr:hypothetical protein [Euryarchaeota archaeon]
MAARTTVGLSNPHTQVFTVILMVFLMFFMGTSSLYTPQNVLENETDAAPADGRQGLAIEDECEGLKFEDLFDYDFANFKVFIGDDWATAEMDAGAFVNGSKSAIVRDNLDGLFEGLSGGGNDYISTDERDAVRAIGPKCIGAMDTRIGMKEGIPHRGAPDWNNLTFVEDGIGLEEIDLVPENHPQERSCQNLGSANGCKEVPVSITEDLQIMMYLAEDQSNNVRFDKLPNSGDSNFTLALNITNMSYANLELNFPLKQGLRMSNYSIQDTITNTDGTMTATENTELSGPEAIYLPDGRLRVNQVVTYATSEYPIQRDLFIDFTTMAPETNEAPEWSSNAPGDGTVIPMLAGQNIVVAGEKTEMWATDDSGWGIDCTFTESGWSSSLDGEGNFMVENQNSQASSSNAECYAVDPFGESSIDSRNWSFGEVFTASAVLSSTGDSIEFTLSPTGLVNEMSINAHAHQSTAMGQIRTTTLSSDDAVLSLPLDGLSPGMVMVMGQAQSTTMLDLDFMMNFGLKKASLAPLISVSKNLDGNNATWEANGLTFTLKGDVLDPDGEDVTLSLLLCGYSTNDFLRDGSGWEINVNIVSCSSQNPPVTAYDIVLTATDESGTVTTYTVYVPDPYASTGDTTSTSDNGDNSEEEGLPGLSMLATLSITLLGAAFVGRQRRD